MFRSSRNSFLDFGQAYRKAADYCAIQDRCKNELKLKLTSWGIDKAYYNKIIAKLLEEGFIDEKRFALNYAGGKFRINGWGKIKIAASLRARSIPGTLIQLGLTEIENEEYLAALKALLQKKIGQLGGNTTLNCQKAARFAASRGFETGLIAAQFHDIDLSDI